MQKVSRHELILEAILTVLILIGLYWIVGFVFEFGYLPQPMHYVPDDTFMDWIHTTRWAWQRTAYSVWESVYPPISFVFLRMFSLKQCYYTLDDFASRDCDWLGLTTLFVFYALNVVLMFVAFWKAQRATAIFRTIAMGLGLPMLFALERANLIIPCFTFFMLAYGNIVESRVVRYLAVAITINFKPYLLLLSLPFVFKRQWRAIELCALLTIGVYLLTLTLNGTGTLGEIATNSRNLIRVPEMQFLTEALYSTSYASLLTLPNSRIPVERFIPSKIIEGLSFAIPIAISLTLAISIFAMLTAWLQPRAVSSTRLGAMFTLTLFVGFVGGQYNYLFMFPLFLVLLGERATRVGPTVAIVMAYLMSIPADYLAAPIVYVRSVSWLTGEPVIYKMGITIGQSLRPGMAMIIVWALSLDTISQVIRAHWRHAPSFGLLDRSDAPLAPYFRRGRRGGSVDSAAVPGT